MKGKLIKVSEGIIFVIDERPKIGDWYIRRNLMVLKCVLPHRVGFYDEYDHKILSSTFGVGLELEVNYKGKFQEILNGKYDGVEMDTEHPYTIQDNKVIIEL